MHGLLQVDVTGARQALHHHGSSRASLPFTAWVVDCVATAVEADRIVRAANRKTVQQISDEIRAARQEQSGDERRYRGTRAGGA